MKKYTNNPKMAQNSPKMIKNDSKRHKMTQNG